MAALPFGGADRRDGVVGLAFAMRNVAPLLLMCDGHDIGLSVDGVSLGGASRVGGLDRATRAPSGVADLAVEPTIFLYDNYPGGIGFSEPLFGMHDELVARTRELIDGCPCQSGCPSCVGPEGATGPARQGRRVPSLSRLSGVGGGGGLDRPCAISRRGFARSSERPSAIARGRARRVAAGSARASRTATACGRRSPVSRRSPRALGGALAAGRRRRVPRDRSHVGSVSIARPPAHPRVRDRHRRRPCGLFDRRIAAVPDWASKLVFFDIETTGLSGGAGTIAFLAGCGWFDAERLHGSPVPADRARPASARCSSRSSAAFDDASVLVTYNGRTFDVPDDGDAVGLPSAAGADRRPAAFRHAARRAAALGLSRPRDRADAGRGAELFALGARAVRAPLSSAWTTCRDSRSRRAISISSGPATRRVIEGVLEHNRHDLVSLAVLTSHALWLAEGGPDACSRGRGAARARPLL